MQLQSMMNIYHQLLKLKQLQNNILLDKFQYIFENNKYVKVYMLCLELYMYKY